MLTEDIIQSKLLRFWSCLKWGIQRGSPYWEGIMNAGGLLKCMDFMMSVSENMGVPRFGKYSQICLITFLSVLWSKEVFSVHMVASHQALMHLIKWNPLIELWKYPTKVHYAIWSGQTPTKDVDGAWMQEEPATHLAKTSQNNSTMQMASN